MVLLGDPDLAWSGSRTVASTNTSEEGGYGGYEGVSVRAGQYHEQTPENQLQPLRAFATARGWSIAEFIDYGVFGAKEKRP